VILIAGGKDKGVDYQLIKPYLKRVKKINLFGQASGKIHAALSAAVQTEIFGTLEEVVQHSFTQAKPGDTVLFSPMCSSFDMFSNYMDRGRKFTQAVLGLHK
jgi:UDP-N-acetylmuramoylalanine--D-glutamate ligase